MRSFFQGISSPPRAPRNPLKILGKQKIYRFGFARIDCLGKKKHFLNKSFMSTIEGISLWNLSNGKTVIQIDANSFYMFANFTKLYLKMRHRSHCNIAKLKKVRTKLLAEATFS